MTTTGLKSARTIPGKPLVLAAVLLLSTVAFSAASLTEAPPATAGNQLVNYHWRRASQQTRINLTLRNQIGPGFEAQIINLIIASWGSRWANNPYPGGPARTDFGFAYQYGGAPSCGPDQVLGLITFCVGPVSGNNQAVASFAVTSAGHILDGYITIGSGYRYETGTYCHEFGHILGLRHGARNTCLWDSYYYGRPPTPGQHNLDMSRTINNQHTH